MILLTIAVIYVFMEILFSCMEQQGKRYQEERERNRQRKELRDALRYGAGMR